MKKVKLKYNPYKVETTITIDGLVPLANSDLNQSNRRLQEWIENFPKILIDEYRDKNIIIEFTGTTADYEDVVSSFTTYPDIKVQFIHNKIADIKEVEKQIDTIYQEIQNGDIEELHDELITEAFNKAKNSMFEINVVATMSSGKSTLINALLGQQLMPAANRATTATIVRIIATDTDSEVFSAKCYNKSNRVIIEDEVATLAKMQEWNKNEEINVIELRGKIPFVSSVGMKLVLVDTPGPNNANNESHREMTYKMLSDSDKSLVLYVMNGEQLGINDEKIFLDYICQIMKEGGKQSRERFIFAVNKMDSFDPSSENDGADGIEQALIDTKKGLEGRGIYNPNIFPVASLPALQLRTKRDGIKARELRDFREMCEEYKSMHFEQYYSYCNLPQSVQAKIEGLKEIVSKDHLIEVYTGILSIEQAISQYVNKYARTTKVYDLVMSFNQKLTELAAIANLENAIETDQQAKTELEKQIENIRGIITSAEEAQTYSEKLDELDFVSSIDKQIENYFDLLKNKVNNWMSGQKSKVLIIEAQSQCDELKKEAENLTLQLKVEIERIIQKQFKSAAEEIINEYKKRLQQLNIGIDSKRLSFDSLSLVRSSIPNISTIIADNTNKVDESYYERKKYKVKVAGTRTRNAAIGGTICAGLGMVLAPLTFGASAVIGAGIGAAYGATMGAVSGSGEHEEEKEKLVKVTKIEEYVDMNQVASKFLNPLLSKLVKDEMTAKKFVKDENQKLKQYIKEEIVTINDILDQKLQHLNEKIHSNEVITSEIVEKQKQLAWLESIVSKVNDIIEF